MSNNDSESKLKEIGENGTADELINFLNTNKVSIYSHKNICYISACSEANLEIIEYIVNETKNRYVNLKNPKLPHPNLSSLINEGINCCVSNKITSNNIKVLDFLMFKTNLNQYNFTHDYAEKLYATAFNKDSILLFNFLKNREVLIPSKVETFKNMLENYLYEKEGVDSELLHSVIEHKFFKEMIKEKVNSFLKIFIRYKQYNSVKNILNNSFFKDSIHVYEINLELVKSALQYNEYKLYEYMITEMKIPKNELKNLIQDVKSKNTYLKQFKDNEEIENLYSKLDLNKKLNLELNIDFKKMNVSESKKTKI